MDVTEQKPKAVDGDRRGGDLFIVDNTDGDWKVRDYLREWTGISHSFDIATGNLEIGALLALDGHWQKLEKLRVLMGNEVTKRTRKALLAGVEALKETLNTSLEREKDTNDFLTGVPAIVDALARRQIECRVYNKDKFHAKAYITHGKLSVVGSSALVGSSNFSFPGLTENVELNVQLKAEVEVLQEWYERHWKDAEDITPEILKLIERHTFEYTPFDVYAKSLQEFFRGHEMTADEWERSQSDVYKILSPYQRDGYHALLKIAARYNGAFLCDGVGLGKTYMGLMLIERLVLHERMNVALFVPKSAREAVWEFGLKQYLPNISGAFTKLRVFNHTDLSRKGKMEEELESVRERADVIIIDEAHNFRNTGVKGEDPSARKSRYWRMFDITEGKKVFLLTATPVNNQLTDLQHMIELFSRRETGYFKDSLGIHTLAGHFRKMEKALEKATAAHNVQEDLIETNLAEAEPVLSQDDLFRALVVQRSRAYVKKSATEGVSEIRFPKPREPKVVPYSVKQTYGKILQMVEDSFNKKEPLFALAIYYPYAYYIGDDSTIDPLVMGRQRQVVSLIRIGFLKRFESSAEAFTMSCWNLLRKLLAWVEVHAETPHEKNQVERWKRQNAKLIDYMYEHQRELFGDEEDVEEDIIPQEMLEAVNKLPRDEFNVGDIIDETLQDLYQVASFLKDLSEFKPKQDKKLVALKNLLNNDAVLSKHKVLIFTEFKDTARYLLRELVEAGIEGVAEIDSATDVPREVMIRRFSPYYNGSSSAQLNDEGLDEIRVLISTDVLSEGLNLQDATRLINYDIHWNPVRLMQRIGRVDRRMNPEIEDKIIRDHPDQKKLRGEVAYFNFLPPDELDELLRLYTRVSKKTLRISKTFGIEGKKLLKPEDDYDDLRDFISDYEGIVSPTEAMHLEFQELIKANPDLEKRLNQLPGRVFSGKKHPSPKSKAVFFCYALPARVLAEEKESAEDQPAENWSLEAGPVQWYLFDLASEHISETPIEIAQVIRSTPETRRHCLIEQPTLSEIRKKVEKHIKNSYLKRVQAPVLVKPVLRAWMELS